MRRLQLLASALVITAGLASYACGGSDSDSTVTDSPIEAPSDTPSGESTPSTPPPASSTPTDPGSPPSTSGGTSGTGTSGGSQSSGGTGTGTGGGNGGGGGGGGGTPVTPSSKCAADSFIEKEGNDAIDAANVLQNATGSACGKLTAANDVDFFTFTMPADANYLGFAGAYTQDGVEFEVTVGDKTFRIGEQPEVRPGSKYVVKAFSKTGKVPADYRFDVQILKK